MAMTIAHGDLRHNILRETGADRIGALGRADPLGAALWRVSDDHDHRSMIAATRMLAQQLRRSRESLPILMRLASAVIREWLDNKCRKCKGRGFMMNEEQVVHVCTHCRGETIRRPSDAERCRALKIDRRAYPKWERRFADAHAVVANANDAARRQVARQLERGWRAELVD
jgi:hypothetical protein